MHDRAPRPEISTGQLTIAADALFAYAQYLESVTGEPGLVHTTPTETGQLEAVHVVTPVGEHQVSMTIMGDDGMTATDTRIVRRLSPVVIERNTAGDEVSYRIVDDPEYRERGAAETEVAHWGSTDPFPQLNERGINKAGPTLNERPLRADEFTHVWAVLTGSTPYNPAEQTLLQSNRGDKLIRNNSIAWLRKLLGQAGLVTSRWAENTPPLT
jgi:hypothetical protein